MDLPVSARRGFVFWRDGEPSGRRARTLREFISIVEQSPVSALDGHLRRHDFSSWIGEVFGDYPLAKTVRRIEDGYLAGEEIGVVADLAHAVRARYEFVHSVPEPNG